MKPAKAYEILKMVMEHGQVGRFAEITKIVPATTLSTTLGMNYQSFNRKLHNPGKFTLIEILKLSQAIGINYKILTDLIMAELEDLGRTA